MYEPTWTIDQLVQRTGFPRKKILDAIEVGELAAVTMEPIFHVTKAAAREWYGPIESIAWRVEDGTGRTQIVQTVTPAEAFLEAAGFAELDLPDDVPWTIPPGIDVRAATDEDIKENENNGGDREL